VHIGSGRPADAIALILLKGGCAWLKIHGGVRPAMEVAAGGIGFIPRSHSSTGCRGTAGFFVQFVGGEASILIVPIRGRRK
jgi:hypothetical protein